MKRKKWLWMALAAVLAAGTVMPVYADDDDDEDPEPVGEIVLHFSSDIEAGDG